MGPHAARDDMVRSLSEFLREHGDLVLSGTRRLTLTTACLNELNDIFSQFLGGQDNDSFIVTYGCSGNSDFMNHVFFLHDFFQKTSSLKIVQSSQTVQGGLDLSKFHCLRILELKRVPPHLLLGVDSLILQLESLICHRSISSLKDILSIRNKARQPWLKLKAVNFSHNSITCLDDCLAELPQLQYLDCSSNAISDAAGIQYLHTIRVLNLSFNFLERISSFSERARESLTVLCLRNNCMETTEGLDGLKNLKELDLSFNCIAERSSLGALKQMSNLNMLELEGNPITYHRNYHSILLSCLPRRVISHQFRLDSKPLPSKHLLISVKASAAKGGGASLSPPIAISGREWSGDSAQLLPAGDSSSLRQVPSVSIETAQQDSISCETHSAVVKPCKVPKSKRWVLRVAAIRDRPPSQTETVASSVAPSGITHEEIVGFKTELESRKQQLGDEWLVGTTQVHLPGAHSTPLGTPNTSFAGNAGPATSKGMLSDSDSGRAESVTTIVLKEAAMEDAEASHKGELDSSPRRRISQMSQGVEVLPDQPDHVPEADSCALEGLSWITEDTEPKGAVETGEDVDSKLFLAQKYVDGGEMTVFLGVKNGIVRESDSLTGKIMLSLDLSLLVSAVLDNGEMSIKLKFDTVVRRKKELKYAFEDRGDAEEFFLILEPFMRAKALKDMALDALQCLKCGALFLKRDAKRAVVSSKAEGNAKKDMSEVDICPHCDSSFLVEAPISELAGQPPGTAGDQEEGTVKVLPVPHEDTSSEESIEAVNTESGRPLHRPGFRKSQSDITVLSNPSQSSIAVLSSTSAMGNAALDAVKEVEHTVSPPPTVILPTLREIMSMPASITKGQYSSSVEERGVHQSYSDAVLSDSSFESARSHMTLCERPALASVGSAGSLKSTCLWELLRDTNEVTPEAFVLLNHRVRLYLEVTVFVHDEDFVCALKTWLIPSTTLEEVSSLFVVSTRRAYFFRIVADESEEPQSWLQMVETRPLEALKSISLMLGNQGFRLSWQADWGNVPWHLCLTRDADCCNCFLQYFTGTLKHLVNTQPKVETSVTDSLAQLANEVLPLCCAGEPSGSGSIENDVALYLMVFWKTDTVSKAQTELEPVSLVVTGSEVCVARTNYIKDVKVANMFRIQYTFLSSQKISNLTALHLHEDLVTVTLTFLDEDAGGAEMKWTVQTATKASVHTFLNTLRSPWEELFGIEMPLLFISQ